MKETIGFAHRIRFETMIKVIVLLIAITANLHGGDCAIMEAMIEIDSDNFRMTSFLERFKKFIARSHTESSLDHESKWVNQLVHHNDTFQANYDFSRNLLTMMSSYSLLLNGTDQKISDVKITINFRFNQETNDKIILEDVHGDNVIPKIEYEKGRQFDYDDDEVDVGDEWCDTSNEECKSKKMRRSSFLGKLLSHIVEIVEPVIVAFIHIVINGVLGHVLATAFDHLYNGRLITI
ncbi:UNVERIFIED_CONTAM: hypothetical protein PYX00_002337 [Menopon gallinae]|uniref:Uncharacterized protein n=1 Tax=Menopon gallinae TaxID=328185 RepID=A0AAW2IGQ0_9NEOP